MTAMHSRRLRLPCPVALVVVVAAVLLAACGEGGATPAATGGPSSPPPSTAPATPGSTTPTPATPVPSSTGPAATPPTTTETPWGTIWDAVPPGFPAPGAGARPVEVAEAVSATWSLDQSAGPVARVADYWVGALQAAGWSIEGLGTTPEDGSSVIDAVGGAATCRAEVTITPRGTEILVTVRYAATCPWR